MAHGFSANEWPAMVLTPQMTQLGALPANASESQDFIFFLKLKPLKSDAVNNGE
jgi:hypothetical protein